MKKVTLCFYISVLLFSQSSFALTKQEVMNISSQIAGVLKQVSVYANQGDAKNACSSARKAISLFVTINPDEDIDTATERRLYSEAATSVNKVMQSMQGVCF